MPARLTMRGARARHPMHAVAGVLLALALLLGGCGEDAAEPATPTPTPSPTPTPTPIAVNSPQVLDSYRYHATIEASGAALGSANPFGSGDFQMKLEVQGAVINPDREHTQTIADLGFFTLRSEEIRIGDRTWGRDGTGPWREGRTGGAFGMELPAVTPAGLFSDDDESLNEVARRLEGREFVREMVNGVATLRYDFTREEFEEVFATEAELVPDEVDLAEFDVSLWLSEEHGVPVRIVLNGRTEAGVEAFLVEMNITDLNSGAIAIEEPV
jgi:hypothetical protein